jgi:hypothetical protein
MASEKRALNGFGLLGERGRCADDDHRGDTRWLDRGHVERCDAAAAQANHFDAI